MPHFLTFATEAEMVAIYGCVLVMLAIFAGLAEWKRTRRARIESVGWVPWFPVSFICMISGAGMIVLSVKSIAGS